METIVRKAKIVRKKTNGKSCLERKKTYEEDGQIIKTVRKETEGKTCKK